MRSAFKKTLILLAFYAVGSAALIFGAYRALDSSATAVMEEIARLVGREIVSAFSEPLLEDILGPEAKNEEAVGLLVHELAHSSEIVRTATLVGPSGGVIATDDPELSETASDADFPSPGELFAEDRRTRFVNLHGPGLGTGIYQMEIPLLRQGEPAAYLRLVLESGPISRLYSDTRGRLFAAAALGLAVIGFLAFLLHLQVRRGERRLLHMLEDAIEGREVPAGATSRDQFRLALDAAVRLGRELHTYRKRDAQASQALEVDLRLASQLRGLMGLYMGIAHDLKAPLNAMVLNLELLKRSLPEATEKQNRWIRILEEEFLRLRRSVERLLAQTAPMRAETVRYDLGQLVTEISELLAPQARQQKVALEVEVPSERLMIRGLPDLTKQALVNLAVNGFEALADGGRLRIEAAVREGHAVLRVSDDGPGIEPDLTERIYDLHFTTKKDGTGLGLHVTRAMIESQGGTLHVVETGPAGTTFELCLPADRPPEAPPCPEPSS